MNGGGGWHGVPGVCVCVGVCCTLLLLLLLQLLWGSTVCAMTTSVGHASDVHRAEPLRGTLPRHQ